jgi:DNA polymerase III subunit delta'
LAAKKSQQHGAETPAEARGGPILERVRGQDAAVATLKRALATGHVHHAYLFEGPGGVGRELAALGFAQALVCIARTDGSNIACGTCSACMRSELRDRRTRHPDIVFLERGLYEPGLIDRKTPETQDLSVDQVRTLVLARAAFGPHEGKAKVFIIRNADELSTAAANALLKTLEEPLQRTFFILITARCAALLPTVRSRTLPIRFRALGDEIRAIIAAESGAASTTSCASPSADDPHPSSDALKTKGSETTSEFAEQLWQAVCAPTFTTALEWSATMKKPRHELTAELETAALWFAEKARTCVLQQPAAGENTQLRSPEHRAEVALFCAVAHDLVIHAHRDIEGNAAPQLRMEQLASAMRRNFPRSP